MMTMIDNDNDTICTSELLDLIQADIVGDADAGLGRSNAIPPLTPSSLRPNDARKSTTDEDNSGNRYSKNRYSLNHNEQQHQQHHDPFRVRLTRRVTDPKSNSPTTSNSSASSNDWDSSEEHDNVEEIIRPLARSGWRNQSRKSKKHSSNGISLGKNNNHNYKRTSARISQQKMPLGGGYGGMFHDYSNGEADAGATAVANGRSEGSDDNSSSAASSVFSFTSKFFSNHRNKQQRHDYQKSHNPYLSSTSSRHSMISCASGTTSWQDKYFILVRKALLAYLQLPFRVRYFLQLFAIIAIFMLASLNFFIVAEVRIPSKTSMMLSDSRGYVGDSHRVQQDGIPNRAPREDLILEGGGASLNRIPRLRAQNPLNFLHRNVDRSNGLFDRAVAKLQKSVRFGHQMRSDGDSTGSDSRVPENHGQIVDIDDVYSPVSPLEPFQYGWKSMPRLITTNFATGLSDDEIITIQYANNAEYFQSMMGKIKQNLYKGENMDVQDAEEEPLLPPKGTVAYVLPVVTCYPSDEGIPSNSIEKDSEHLSSLNTNQPKDSASFRDFAVMLRAMVHAQSYRNSASGSVYDYKMHAVLHPHATKCRDSNDLFKVRTMNNPSIEVDDGIEGGMRTKNDWKNGVIDRSVLLQDLGYQVSVQYPPINPESIQGSDYLRKHLSTNPDMMNDLIRLYAYELEEYDAVVLVDYDTLILRPIDEIIDLIVDSGNENQDDVIKDQGDKINIDGIDAVFSWEHLPSFVNPHARASAINLSFFALRPSKTMFEQLVKSYLTSPFSENRGWGSIGRGSFQGWMTTQGFLTYYYDEVANAAKIEVNRCSFGNSGEDFDAKNSILITNEGKIDCFGSNAGQCNDCSTSKFEEIVVADLSYCRAPWECGDSHMDGTTSGSATDGDEGETLITTNNDMLLSSNLCRQYQRLWFSGRLQMEDVHPQLQKGNGKLCIDGQYQPMIMMKPAGH